MIERSGGVLGLPTRGTTHPQRLRRIDRWLLAQRIPALLEPVATVVDVGFGANPRTSAELLGRLRAAGHTGVRVVGMEIDAGRVATAAAWAVPGLTFRRAGFELAGLTGVAVIRAMNVLRQYDESAVTPAWSELAGRLAPGGLLVEGTCDEIGRVGSWVAIRSHRSGIAVRPETLTFASALEPGFPGPRRFAERLPKALIHHNHPGEPIHAFLLDWQHAWERQVSLSTFGARQRFIAAAKELRASWPVRGGQRRWRLGELSVDWEAVRPGRG